MDSAVALAKVPVPVVVHVPAFAPFIMVAVTVVLSFAQISLSERPIVTVGHLERSL